ncbi:transcription factor LBX2-like isoform X2 [Ahaetulla prasina]|uniref:transcription factor LBX2-like isoform X2 n=1 Tax=Ahaetulla prasina TaxID=499056 RepID=UPI0026491B86|nr:transcription factor LBX2-like isoform X2 [Ahaetulla prasina]
MQYRRRCAEGAFPALPKRGFVLKQERIVVFSGVLCRRERAPERRTRDLLSLSPDARRPPHQERRSAVMVLFLSCPGRDQFGAFGPRPPSKKRRKSRTAFTNHQIYELEKRFLYQKYLSPADRDHIAAQLGLSNAQVITWFQNRRAKLKRDLEEMKADVESLKKLPPAALKKLASMPELEPPGVSGPARARGGNLSRTSPPPSPSASRHTTDPFSDGEEEEEEEEEIDVGD